MENIISSSQSETAYFDDEIRESDCFDISDQELIFTELELLAQYRLNKGSSQSDSALVKLLWLHKKLLWYLARKISFRFSKSSEIDDFSNESIIGAMKAYDSFDSSRNLKLSTHVFNVVRCHLEDSSDHHALVRIPRYLRSMRSYLSGKYDSNPQKKLDFEQKNKIEIESQLQEARMRYSLLSCEFGSLDKDSDSMHVQSIGPSEDDIIARIDLEKSLSMMSPRSASVLLLSVQEDLTSDEIATRLSITEGQVRSDLRKIRAKSRTKLQGYE